VVSADGIQKSKDQLDLDGRLVPVAARRSILSLKLGLHETAQVSFGNLAFAIRFVSPAPAVVSAGLDQSDYRFVKIVGICLLAFIALLTAIGLTSPQLRPLDTARSAERYVRFLVRPAQRAKAEKKDSLVAKPTDQELKEKQDAKKEQAEASRKGAPVGGPNRREEDRRKVMGAGLLGALKGGASASNIFGPGGLGTGVNNALGGLRSGAGQGNAQGIGGQGSRGSGPGGGGIGLGKDGLGTKGLGTGGGGGGYASLDLGNRTKESTRIIPGKTIVLGGLSKDVIARVIRSHQHEIKYCYEVELQKNPSLSGKVTVMFTIDATGAVAENKISETTLHNLATERCMLARIQRWRFPEPAGGGEVNVTFPWFFKLAGVDAKGEQG
jgi:TonB family protein